MTHFLKAHEETHCYPAMWVVEYSYPTRRMAVMLPNAIAHRERRCLSSSQCSANIELELNDVRMSTVDCQLKQMCRFLSNLLEFINSNHGNYNQNNKLVWLLIKKYNEP